MRGPGADAAQEERRQRRMIHEAEGETLRAREVVELVGKVAVPLEAIEGQLDGQVAERDRDERRESKARRHGRPFELPGSPVRAGPP